MGNNLTIDQSFQKFLTNLNPTDIQKKRIQRTRETIDAALLNDDRISLNTNEQTSFLTGSYSRKTIIRPIDDIDLYVRVNYSKHAQDKSPMSILRLMASSIRKRHTQNTKVNVDAPCVVVKFSNYKFEIVPAVGVSNNPDLYMIPAPGSKQWIYCYPNMPGKWLSNCNHKNNSFFIPLIKMLKQWNRQHNVGLKSFHIELLTEQVFTSITDIDSYPQAIFDWMYCVQNWIWKNSSPFVHEPGKNDIYIDEYLYEKASRLRVVRKRLDLGLKNAERAWNLYSKGNYSVSKRIWHRIFGPKFPVPQQATSAPQLVSPNLSSTPTLKDVVENNSVTGLLGGLSNNSQLNAFTNPVTKPSLKAMVDMFSKPKDPFK